MDFGRQSLNLRLSIFFLPQNKYFTNHIFRFGKFCEDKISFGVVDESGAFNLFSQITLFFIYGLYLRNSVIFVKVIRGGVHCPVDIYHIFGVIIGIGISADNGVD